MSGVNENLAHSSQIWPRRRMFFYLLPFLFVPILIFVAAVFIVPTRWFALRSGNTYLASLGYGLTLDHADCQILVTGDSSALVSVDPAILSRATGLSACNIAEFEGMTLVNGTSVLDHYLARNKPPHYLVFLYAPEDLTRAKPWNAVSSFEAISYRLQHERNLRTLVALASHPAESFGFAEQGIRLTLLRLRAHPITQKAADLRIPTQGQLQVANEKPLTGCSAVPVDAQPDRTWLAQLRTRYARQGTVVLIDATPVPECEPGLDRLRLAIQGAADNLPLPTLPIGDYVGGGRLHVGPAGSKAISDMIATQIAAQQHTSPKGI